MPLLLGAGALALLATAATSVLKRPRTAAAAPPRRTPTIPPATPPGQERGWSVERLRELDEVRFAALCAAYYARRQFQVETLRMAGRTGVDTKLFFARLPAPVAIMRCVSPPDGVADVHHVLGVLDRMITSHVAKGILHTTGGYTEEAARLARANKVQLVSGEELIRNMSGLPDPARQELRSFSSERRT